MKKILLILIAILLLVSCKEEKDIKLEKLTSPVPSNLTQEFSYVYGQNIAASFTASDKEIDLEYIIHGIEDAMNETNHYSVSQSNDIIAAYQKESIEILEDKIKKARDYKLEFLNSFLKINKERNDVISINDKIQYTILTENKDGKKTSKDSMITIDYEIKVLSGDIKDSTYDKEEKMTINLSSTFPGFQAVLRKMREGERVRAWIHPDFAYGVSGYGNIEPNELLIVDIELHSVNDI